MGRLIERIYSGPHSGKSTAAGALVHGYARLGIHAAYVTYSEGVAVGQAHFMKLPVANCYAFRDELVDRGVLDCYQAIILDEVQLMKSAHGDALDALAERFKYRVVPFPSLIGFYNVPRGSKHATA